MRAGEIYYWIKHKISKNKNICPRCKNKAFRHGFFPNERYYCTNCHLLEKKK